MDFLRFSTSTQSLIEQARYIAYSPARKSSFAKMGDLTFISNPKIKMMDYMPTSPDHLKHSIAKSAAFWTNYGPQLSQRFSAWLAS
ncbi:MAG: ABC transporter substrate-binding protein, partial [Paracoccaceae bacterium]|nr:ABC transporter substrate-binding protein [Paracoccaceae bacterium]